MNLQELLKKYKAGQMSIEEVEAALMTMLQSCSPGLVVVNIDNGFGAGAAAGLIAKRAAEARGMGP
jgi:NCAIR mutase (PurE)-related protein